MMRTIAKNKILSLILLSALFFLNTAHAGPPFISDNPEPTEYKHVELYFFSALDKTNDAANLQIPAVEADWGFAPNWQLHLVVPGVLNMPQGEPNTYGLGDIETGFTYRFIQETKDRPQVAIAPIWEIPSGDKDRGLGNGRGWLKLPVWLQKTWGSWTTYGGSGYVINSAPEARNYSFASLVVQHDLNDKWTLGSEIFTQGASAVDSRAYTMLTVGGYYNFNKHFSLLFSTGHSIIGEAHLQGYVGVHWVS